MILLLFILMIMFPKTHKTYKFEPYLQWIFCQEDLSLTICVITLYFFYLKVCLSHGSTAVTDSELVPPETAVVYGYT